MSKYMGSPSPSPPQQALPTPCPTIMEERQVRSVNYIPDGPQSQDNQLAYSYPYQPETAYIASAGANPGYSTETPQFPPNYLHEGATSLMYGMSQANPVSSAGRRSPTLPSKVYDCKSSVVLVQDLIQSGVAELEGGDGKLAYCFFQAKDVITKYTDGSLSERIPTGSRVKCNAWLLDDTAKIPYLVSTIWTEGTEVPTAAVDKILGMPSISDMQMYHKISKDLAWMLPSNRKLKKEKKDKDRKGREREKEKKKDTRRDERDIIRDENNGRRYLDRLGSPSPDRGHSGSSRRSRSGERGGGWRGNKRSRSRERRDKKRNKSTERRRSSSRERKDSGRSRSGVIKDEKTKGKSRSRESGPSRNSEHDRKDPHRSVDELLAKNYDAGNSRGYDERTSIGEGEFEEIVIEGNTGGVRRRRFSEEGKVSRGKGRFVRGGRGNFPRKKLAIGRNVFPDGEEESDETGAGRGRGKPKLAIGRNVFNDPSETSGGRGEGRGRFSKKRGVAVGRNVFESEDRPGLGFTKPAKAYPVRENSRWKRWQGLCRKKPGEEDPNDNIAEFPSRETSPVSDGEELLESTNEPEDYRARPGSQLSLHRSDSPGQAIQQGQVVQVLTYENEEVGILSGVKDMRILFHINQVWTSHSSAGFCPFREIYPTSDLSKHFYPGRSVLCWARSIPPTKQANFQATAVWLEGESPDENLYRTTELPAELNFHLTEYQTGAMGKLDEVVPSAKHRSMEAVVQEYVSHEIGVAKLTGADGGVVLFHLAQVWTFNSTWVPYTSVMTKPLIKEYLPIGTKVAVAVRKLPASVNSQLRYQAMVIWNKDVCSLAEERVGGGMHMFSRRGLEEGGVPPAYVARYTQDKARAGLIQELDTMFDNFKKLCKLDMKSINPVPVILNLLPEDWEAKVVKVVDQENGVICISHRKGHDMSGDLKLGVTKMFAVFHIEDVFCMAGGKYRTSPDHCVAQLLPGYVDLTARSIVSEGGQTMAAVFHTAASQLLLSQMISNVACPVLQAVTVYIKPDPAAEPNITLSPRPTYVRAFPESFHCDEPSTSFYLSYLLQLQLDVKALNFFSATNQARLQKEINNGLAMAHFNSMKKNNSIDKVEQQKLVDEMLVLDHCNSRQLTYGSYQPLKTSPFSPSLPQYIPSVRVRVQLLYQQGFWIREGVVKFTLPLMGNQVLQYAFFDMSCYKFSLRQELRVRDLAAVCPVYAEVELKAHLLLANKLSPIPYVCTAVWNTANWKRDPDTVSMMDPLFIQKYERIAAIISSETSTSPAPDPTKSIPHSVLPSPIPAHSMVSHPTPAVPPTLCWASEELLKARVGKVTNIIDGNYGIAVVRYSPSNKVNERHRAIVLFDTCDVWLGLQTAQQLDLTLNQVMVEGDYVKMKAIMVPESGNRKNIRYLATSLVTGKERRTVKKMELPEMEPLENIDQIHPSKINNFYAVVSAVCHNIPGDAEDECKGVSSDEEEFIPPIVAAVASSSNPFTAPPPGVDKQMAMAKNFANSGSSVLSLDAYEKDREKKKLAKANECLQSRRKLGYDRVARDKLLFELKLKNQLLWRCPECNITCGKAGMEKHITSKSHWDKVLENYKKLLDTQQPSATG